MADNLTAPSRRIRAHVHPCPVEIKSCGGMGHRSGRLPLSMDGSQHPQIAAAEDGAGTVPQDEQQQQQQQQQQQLAAAR